MLLNAGSPWALTDTSHWMRPDGWRSSGWLRLPKGKTPKR